MDKRFKLRLELDTKENTKNFYCENCNFLLQNELSDFRLITYAAELKIDHIQCPKCHEKIELKVINEKCLQ